MTNAGPNICLFLLCLVFEKSEKTLFFCTSFFPLILTAESWVIVKQTLQCLGRSRIEVSLTSQQNTSKVKNTPLIDRAPHRQTWHLSVLSSRLGALWSGQWKRNLRHIICEEVLLCDPVNSEVSGWQVVLHLNSSWAQNWFWSHSCFRGSLQGLLPLLSCPCITSSQLSSFLLRAWKINLGLYASIFLHLLRVGYHRDFFFPCLYSPQVASNLRRCVKTAYTYFTHFCVIYHHFSIYQNSTPIFPNQRERFFVSDFLLQQSLHKNLAPMFFRCEHPREIFLLLFRDKLRLCRINSYSCTTITAKNRYTKAQE